MDEPANPAEVTYPFTDTKPKIDPKACADGSFLTGIKVLKHEFVLKRVPGRG